MNRFKLEETRHGTMLYDADDMFIGKALENYGEYSWTEAQLMIELVTSESVVVEGGCHIGSFTIPMAKKARIVYAFEPQRIVFQNLCANIALNGLRNVHTWHAALGAELGVTLCPVPEEWENVNTGGVTLRGVTSGEMVPVYCVDWLKLERLDLLRADIEDMELEMIVGARETIKRCRPVVYLESNTEHDPLLQEMFDLGYDCYWHFPAIGNPNNFKKKEENIMTFVRDGSTFQYVTYNLLCLPRGGKWTIDDPKMFRAKLGDKCGEVCNRAYLK